MHCKIYDRSDVSLATEEIRTFIADFSFSEKNRLEILTAAREAMLNVVKYATKGTLTIKKIKLGSNDGIEMLVDDIGIGISNIEKSLESGYSSSGTMGIGLNVLINSMDETIIIPKEDGVTFVMRKFTQTIKQFCSFSHKLNTLELAMKSMPSATYEKSGDCGIALETPESIFFAHWDVEGHGSDRVYQTSLILHKYILALHYYDMRTILNVVNKVLFKSLSLGRASIAIGRYDKKTQDIDILRLGNINYLIYSKEEQIKSLSANGVLGVQSISPEHFTIHIDLFQQILFYSDGVDSLNMLHLLSHYQDLEAYEMVDTLLKKNAIERDDSSILLLNHSTENYRE